ncbi:hypothetical protein ACGFJ5_10795 [Micromonospora echinaurantiaca]|uniref:hypothetical protein n=1 Tax=Micromonospora echinaurantiaca TaxID=47857 RepID=UPI00371B8C22
MISIARTARAVAVVWRAGRADLAAYVVLAPIAGALPVLAAWLTKLVLDRVTDTAGGPILGVATALAVVSVGLALVPHLTNYLRADLGRSAAVVALDQLYAAWPP